MATFIFAFKVRINHIAESLHSITEGYVFPDDDRAEFQIII